LLYLIGFVLAAFISSSEAKVTIADRLWLPFLLDGIYTDFAPLLFKQHNNSTSEAFAGMSFNFVVNVL
jgi:hypothetical protein